MTLTTGGRHPYNPKGALVGPFNALYAPTSVAVPADLYDIVNGIKDVNGIYQPQTGWVYTGLAADAHSYTHSRDTEGIEYDNVAGDLFEKVSDITRLLEVHFAELLVEQLKIIENTATSSTIAAATNQAPQTKVPFGVYDSLLQYRFALVGYRPEDANVGLITEGTAGPTRPPMYATVFPLVTLSTEDSEFSFDKADPVDVPVTFKVSPEATLPAGQEHGFHVYENAPATIATA